MEETDVACSEGTRGGGLGCRLEVLGVSSETGEFLGTREEVA